MQAIRVHTHRDTGVLELEDVACPSYPGPGQALVKIEACGVNYIDIYYRTVPTRSRSRPLSAAREPGQLSLSATA